MAQEQKFAENFQRLLGLHRLTAKEFSRMADVSESVISKWLAGKRNPSFTSARVVGGFFRVNAMRLADADFGDLLADELADKERFREVEKEIEAGRRALKGTSKVVSIKKGKADGRR
jgi:transcriptional regulator with XRE-family HTH domain